MGKKKSGTSNLGRSLIKDRFSGRRFDAGSSLLHTADVADGYDWGRLNLQSVTEESSFQDFLSTAELAGTEFQAEKLNIAFVSPGCHAGLLSEKDKERLTVVQDENKRFLQIPRRPDWNEKTTSEELQALEREAFLEWRRKLALFQEENAESGIILTPYEKNIEFWRQLWRVVEKSDIVIQIVDGRNPLLFRCEDLERYVEEVSLKQDRGKTNFILVNKADFLTKSQRKAWATYFNTQRIRIAFFSAIKDDSELTEDETSSSKQMSIPSNVDGGLEVEDVEKRSVGSDSSEENGKLSGKKTVAKESPSNIDSLGKITDDEEKESLEDKVEASNSVLDCSQEDKVLDEKDSDASGVNVKSGEDIKNSSKIMTRTELISLFKKIWVQGGGKSDKNVRTVGLVGYPNVGKSSTINALLEAKKVSVSATPGKTKHFQTLFLDSELLLCDCPGLVMPSFVSTQAEMVLWGVLPVDRLRDHVPSVSLLCSLIPRHVLEGCYGIMLPSPMEGEDPKRPPTSEELLNAYGYIRGYMTQRGNPDNPRTARYVLKDFVNGKLLYCKAPPDWSQEEFHTFPCSQKKNKVNQDVSTASGSSRIPPHLRQNKISVDELDKNFFRQASIGVHSKGIKAMGIGGSFPRTSEGSSDVSAKPWKKHNNKNKKEKLRRVYSHLDQ